MKTVAPASVLCYLIHGAAASTMSSSTKNNASISVADASAIAEEQWRRWRGDAPMPDRFFLWLDDTAYAVSPGVVVKKPAARCNGPELQAGVWPLKHVGNGSFISLTCVEGRRLGLPHDGRVAVGVRRGAEIQHEAGHYAGGLLKVAAANPSAANAFAASADLRSASRAYAWHIVAPN